METGNSQPNLMNSSSAMFTSLKGSSDDMSTQSTGLARYHSAPSSTFAALLEQEFYPPSSDTAELLQFLANGELGEFFSYGDAGPSLKANHEPVSSVKKEHIQSAYPNQNEVGVRHSGGRAGSAFQEHISQGPLSAILEHAGEEALVSQPSQQSPTGSTSHKSMLAPNVHFKSNLIRHSSLPSDFLSRLAMKDVSERPAAPHQVGSHVQTTSPRNTDNTGGKVYLLTSNTSPRAVPVRKCFEDGMGSCKAEEHSILDDDMKQCGGLLRQSSSPAGLLSQLTLDEFSTGIDRVGLSSPQGLVHGHAMARWDDAAMDSAMHKIAALGQRKRGRDTDARLYKGVTAADLLMGSIDQGSCPPSSHYSVVGTQNGDSLVTDSVLCKSRAKRGCATHPRSIAERVRRMKISERMKKLQDLVPNLDKQAHTADMLDEVVEYVKLLQGQVKELSKHSDECNGMCRQKGSNSLEI